MINKRILIILIPIFFLLLGFAFKEKIESELFKRHIDKLEEEELSLINKKRTLVVGDEDFVDYEAIENADEDSEFYITNDKRRQKLAEYMKENNYKIKSGEYIIGDSNTFEEIIAILEFEKIDNTKIIIGKESKSQSEDTEKEIAENNSDKNANSSDVVSDKNNSEKEKSTTTTANSNNINTSNNTSTITTNNIANNGSLENKSDKEYLVCIDPGHQGKGNYEKEPIGPGATEMKAKVTSGTAGKFTRIPEHQLNLEVSLMLQKELESRGYRVIMVRTTPNVNISNSERAAIANNNKADAFVRIHANGSEDPSKNGAMTICMTKNNKYNAHLYEDSYRLSANILDSIVESTGCRREYIWETDTMSGINWCEVPVTIIEMGYMSNREEDEKLATNEYREKMVVGIANGIDKYFQR